MSIKVGGKQWLTMLDGFMITPLDIHQGLTYLDMHPFTDQEWNKLDAQIILKIYFFRKKLLIHLWKIMVHLCTESGVKVHLCF